MKKRKHQCSSDPLVDGWKCPICKRDFKSEACQHSWDDVYRRNDDDRIRRIVQEQVKKK